MEQADARKPQGIVQQIEGKQWHPDEQRPRNASLRPLRLQLAVSTTHWIFGLLNLMQDNGL